MNIHVTDGLSSGIGYQKAHPTGGPMREEAEKPVELFSPDEFNAPISLHHTSFLRVIEIIREETQEVPWLTMNHLSVLLHVMDMDAGPFGLEMQNLPSMTGLKKSTVNRLIHSFGDKGRNRQGLGLLYVEKDDLDGRIKRIFLTKDGFKLRERLQVAAREDAEMYRIEDAQIANVQMSVERGLQANKIAYEKQQAKRQNHSLKAESIGMSVQGQDLTITYNESGKRIAQFQRYSDAPSILTYTEADRMEAAIDRAMSQALADRDNAIFLSGNGIATKSAHEIREIAHSDDDWFLVEDFGYWNLYSYAAMGRKKGAPPSFIQRNLTALEIQGMVEDLLARLDHGHPWEAVLDEARTLNAAQYASVRSKLTQSLAEQRTKTIEGMKRAHDDIEYLKARKEHSKTKADILREEALRMPVQQTNEKKDYLNMAHQAASNAAEAEGALELNKEDLIQGHNKVKKLEDTIAQMQKDAERDRAERAEMMDLMRAMAAKKDT
jgi:DNA-binding MarR family transcriptional regulator